MNKLIGTVTYCRVPIGIFTETDTKFIFESTVIWIESTEISTTYNIGPRKSFIRYLNTQIDLWKDSIEYTDEDDKQIRFLNGTNY